MEYVLRLTIVNTHSATASMASHLAGSSSLRRDSYRSVTGADFGTGRIGGLPRRCPRRIGESSPRSGGADLHRRFKLRFLMDAEHAIELIQFLEQHGLEVYVDGGWAVDALLGHQTRAHLDLDIAI